MSYTSVKGMKDLLPPESSLWSEIEKTAQTLFESFGFSRISTPILERTELFTRGVGKATDIVEKQMYSFEDKNHESMTLRPEGTAPVVRAYIEHQMYHPDPYQKLYYIEPMFRYERMQKGRYRQHTQIGAEIFGANSPKVDAELIFMLTEFYKKLGITNFKVEINSLGCNDCRPTYREKLLAHFKGKTSELCADCQNRLEKNPLRILDCKNESCKKIALNAPQMSGYLCEPCKTHFNEVKDTLTQLQVAFEVNPNIVRGLDYYVRTTFEIVSSDLGAQSALGGGGRYDGLVKALGGPEVSAIGFGCGMERLLIALENKPQPKRGIDLFIASLGLKSQSFAVKLGNQLRLKGIKTEVDYEDRPLKTQLKRADRINANYVLMIGEDELTKQEATLRNMNTKEQTAVPFSKILETLQKELQK